MQAVHRMSAEMKHVRGRDQERHVAQLGHLVQAEWRDAVEQLAGRRLPQRHPIGIDRNELYRPAAPVADDHRVAIAAQHQADLDHLGEFEPVLPLVRLLKERRKRMVGDLLA